MESVLIAFSGGADSTFLLRVAIDALGRDKVLAVTARSHTFPFREYAHAKAMAKYLSAHFVTIHTKETEDPAFLRNPANRCYYCKKELFGDLLYIAKKRGIKHVADGCNYDDRKDMRYGTKAAQELGVRSPLLESKIGKNEIRSFSKRLRLPTWSKPSFACLASRIPYDYTITKEKLKKIEKAENFLYKLGLSQLRVRLHGNVARIELSQPDMKRLFVRRKLQNVIVDRLKRSGFAYVAIDLEGYRTGSMNEPLPNSVRHKKLIE